MVSESVTTGQRSAVMAADSGAASRSSRWLIVLLSLIAVGLYGWALSRGAGHFFYSGAVRTMSEDWRAFFYGAVDPTGWITIDKLPGWLWVHALFVRVFGMHTWVLLLPEMLAAAGTVPLLHGAVRRWAGPRAALWAVLAFLCTPITFAAAQVNIPDTLMVLCVVAAAYTLTRALEGNGWGWLLGSALLLGLGFHMKMVQALLVLPGFCLAYLVCASPPPLARLTRTVVYGVVTLLTSSLWMIAVSLTPVSARPKIDGSGNGTDVWHMVLVYNGVNRTGSANTISDVFGGPPGPARLFDIPVAQQISWLLPIAMLFGLFGLATTARGDRRGLAGWLIWGGWLATSWVALSLLSSSIHPYYTAMLTPAVAALVGAGLDRGFIAWRDRRVSGWVLPVGVLLTGLWTLVVMLRQPFGLGWLVVPVAVAAVVTVGLLLLARRNTGAAHGATRVAWLTAAVALLAAPAVWMLTTPAVNPRSVQVIDPVAGPVAFQADRERLVGNLRMPAVNPALLQYVRAQDTGERFVLAVRDSGGAGPYLAAGVNVLPLRGSDASSPTIPADELSTLVRTGQVRHVLMINQLGLSGVAEAQRTWVNEHCRTVPAAEYDPAAQGQRPLRWDPILYDCRS